MTDETALEEIENIAKVFAYEQRMKEFMSSLHPQHKRKKAPVSHEKNMGENNKFIQPVQPHNLVKGLC